MNVLIGRAIKRCHRSQLFCRTGPLAIIYLIIFFCSNDVEAQPYCTDQIRGFFEVDTDEAFYAELPNKITDLGFEGFPLRYQRIPLDGIQDPESYRLYRILYISSMTQVEGGVRRVISIATSGLVAFPEDRENGGAIRTGLQTLVYTHGTVGIN